MLGLELIVNCFLCCARWVVENQIGRENLVIDDCDSKQSVYIFGCKNSVLNIQGSFPFFVLNLLLI